MPARTRKYIHWGIFGGTALVLIAAIVFHGRERPPNFVLITIDTVRADHVSAYGYGRITSPVLDGLAERGVLFRHAVSQAPWTLPAMASLFTSLYPSEHGAVHAATRLSDDVETLAEALGREGYHTVGVVSHSFLDRAHGLAQGFDVFDESVIQGYDAASFHQAVTSETLTEIATGYLRQAERHQPFLLWVHYFDPHYSYVRHPLFGFAGDYDGELPARITAARLDLALQEARSNGEELLENDLEYVEAVYDEEIAHTDYWIGQLLWQIRAMDLDESTVVMLTADHGEYFMERGRFFHGKDVYEALVHVPLILAGAIPMDLRGRTVDRFVELASLPKTVMVLAGVRESVFGGEDVLALAEEPREGTAPPVFTEGSYAWGADERKTAVIWSDWKLIHHIDDDTYELYHLGTDKAERTDLWADPSEELAGIRTRLEGELGRFPPRRASPAPGIDLDDDTMERLRSLGYVK